MKENETEKTEIEKAAEDLFNFAIDREDVKWLLERLPEACGVKPGKVDYELQLLKVISVGWGLNYHLEKSPLKAPLSELFWAGIQEFARDLSTTTGLMIGKEIDYFQTIKERLDMYVAALGQLSPGTEPATAIGPAFAKECGDETDLFAGMTGSKLFLVTIGRVKKYLDALEEQMVAGK